MRIAVTGSRGLIGSALVPFLESSGHEVVRIVRGSSPGGIVRDQPGGIAWDPAGGRIEADRLRDLDAVVHLGGASLQGRWNEARKREIQESRQRGTELLARALAGLDRGPRVLICASGIGFYGDRGEAAVTEADSQGAGFLAETVRLWEQALLPAAEAGIRTIALRFGMVLTPSGGALAKLLPLFRAGLGARFGSGRQWVSWVALSDVLRVIAFALENETLHGPVNVVAPRAVTNAELSRALGRAVSRPAVFRIPGILLRIGLGPSAEEMLLTGARALPARLEAAGYRFAHPDLDEALRSMLRGEREQIVA